jgi:hypothetical protein
LAKPLRDHWTIELTCPNCGIPAEYYESDLAASVFWDLDPHHFEVRCPVDGCGVKTKINATRVPRLIRERVISAYLAAKASK